MNGTLKTSIACSAIILSLLPAGRCRGGQMAAERWDGASYDADVPAILADVDVGADGTVYLTDYPNGAVLAYTPGGHLRHVWGELGQGYVGFSGPSSLAVAPDGKIYVIDDLDRVRYFSSSGEYLGEWPEQIGPSEEFSIHGVSFGICLYGDLQRIAAGPGGEFFVGALESFYVRRLTAGGSYLGYWGGRGSADGEFNGVSDVTVSPSGVVYVVDGANNRVQYFTAAGSFLGKWGSEGTAAGEFRGPRGIAVGPSGDVYVADAGNCRVQKFTSEGKFLAAWAVPKSEGKYTVLPRAVAVAPSGVVYVIAGYEDIWRLRPSGF